MYIIQDNINNYNDNFYNNYNNLNNKDIEKINKLLKIENKKRFILSRHLLYNKLKEIYNLDFNNINIYYNNFGKPFIKECYFNISYSFDYVIVAISDKEIGIDIEKIRNPNLNSINLFCTDNEKKYIMSSRNKNKSFFEIFCLKEAYFKMLGTDLKKMKDIEFNIKNNKVLYHKNNLNIMLNNSINNYIIAIIEKED